ncbi:DUF4352 domain-containing protein [Streptomyces sp. NPDC052287]|uniref:DUF4352 domain-containing protein n=1 Tax=Streptomyces sp. NPDC052287 TaxID=3154950 RepID=UPI0034363484
MHIGRAACTALLLAAAATACSSGEPRTIRVTTTQTVTATPGDDKPAQQDSPLKMGARHLFNDAENNVHTTIQALEYQQPYRGPQPQAPEDFQGGDTWATANVKVCNRHGVNVTVDQTVWSLAYADGTSIEITGSTGGDMPKPEYPMDKTIQPGRCAAGLIAFPVPGKKRPERLVYEPTGGTPTEWAIPKT